LLITNLKLSHLKVIFYRKYAFDNKQLNVMKMKKLLLSIVYLVVVSSLSAQVKFDLGVKGGVNFSKMSFDENDYTAESVTKTHFGAFGRIGWDRVFIQPEVYFSGKGAEVSDPQKVLTNINFKSVDVPLLLGINLVKGKLVDFHVVGGPVFSGITSTDVEGGSLSNTSFYENHFFGIQYGLGIDVFLFTLDARMENAFGEIYSDPTVAGKNQTFMISLGFKFL